MINVSVKNNTAGQWRTIFNFSTQFGGSSMGSAVYQPALNPGQIATYQVTPEEFERVRQNLEYHRKNGTIMWWTDTRLDASWYGVKGDGVADDTAAIQAVIAAARQKALADKSYAADVTFRPGIYQCTSQIVIGVKYLNESDITPDISTNDTVPSYNSTNANAATSEPMISIYGQPGTIFWANFAPGTEQALFYYGVIEGSLHTSGKPAIDGITIVGPDQVSGGAYVDKSSTPVTTKCSGIFCGTTAIQIRNCDFRGMNRSIILGNSYHAKVSAVRIMRGVDGICAASHNAGEINHVEVWYASGKAFSVSGQGVWLTNLLTEYCGMDVFVASCDTLRIKDCYFESNLPGYSIQWGDQNVNTRCVWGRMENIVGIRTNAAGSHCLLKGAFVLAINTRYFVNGGTNASYTTLSDQYCMLQTIMCNMPINPASNASAVVTQLSDLYGSTIINKLNVKGPAVANTLGSAVKTVTAINSIDGSAGLILADATSGSFNSFLPAASSLPNAIIALKKIDNTANSAGLVAGGSGDSIDGSGAIGLQNKNDYIVVQSDGVHTWNIISKYDGTRTDKFRVVTSGPLNVDNSASTWLSDATSGPYNYFLPAASGLPGVTFTFKKTDVTTNAVGIIANGSDKIDKVTIVNIRRPGGFITIQSDGVSRWNVIAQSSETITPEDFGAVGDGSTDDTAAMQAAFTAVSNIAGGVLELGARKIYMINRPLRGIGTPSTSLHIKGGGTSAGLASCIKWNGPGPVKVATGSLVRASNVVTATVTSHPFQVGDKVAFVGHYDNFTGGSEANFKGGEKTITTVTATTFSYSETGANATSTDNHTFCYPMIVLAGHQIYMDDVEIHGGDGKAYWGLWLQNNTSYVHFNRCAFTQCYNTTNNTWSSNLIIGTPDETQCSEIKLDGCFLGGNNGSGTYTDCSIMMLGSGNIKNIWINGGIWGGFNTGLFNEGGCPAPIVVRDVNMENANKCVFNIGYNQLIASGVEVEGNTTAGLMFVQQGAGSNPGSVSLEDCAFFAPAPYVDGTQQTDDVIISVGGTLHMKNCRLWNTRTSTSVPWVMMSDVKLDSGFFMSSFFSFGNHYGNATGYVPAKDGGGVLILPNGTLNGNDVKYHDRAVFSMGDLGGNPGTTGMVRFPAVFGQLEITRNIPTWPGASLPTGVSMPKRGEVRSAYCEWEVDYNALTAAATTQTISLGDLGTHVKVTDARLEVITPFAGVAGTLQAQVDFGGVNASLLLPNDIKAANTYGLVDSDLGSMLARAFAVQGGANYKSTASPVTITVTSGSGNLGNGSITNLTAGKLYVHLQFEVKG